MFERRDSSGNAALTTLFSTVGPADDTMTILDSSGWPTGGANGDFFGKVETEVIRFASRNGTLLTVASNGRGWDNTLAATHQAGAEITHVFTRTDGDEANYAVSETVGKVTLANQLLISDGPNSFTPLSLGTGLLQNIAGALVYAPIQTDSITNDALAPGSVTGTELADGAITTAAKFANNVIPNSAFTDASVTEVELAASIAGNGLAGGAGTALSVGVDGATIEINADQLRVKAGGINSAHLLDGTIVNGDIADGTIGRAKLASEAWTSYAPTWSASGTQPAIGNGTLTGFYALLGAKVVAFRIRMSLGGSSTTGTGSYAFTLPFTAAASLQIASCYLNDATNLYAGQGLIASGATTVLPYTTKGGSSGSEIIVGAGSIGPAADILIQGVYEAA